MAKTLWTEKRLQRLFDRCNRIYWNGRLRGYRLILAKLEDEDGRCDWKLRTITIDVERHKGDREIRATLLHEMVHAATQSRHDVKFFKEVERLLRRGAPFNAGAVRFYAEVVPKRFPLLRKKMQWLARIEGNKVRRQAAAEKRGIRTISDEEVLREFEHPEIVEMRWQRALRFIAYKFGLTDETGRPLSTWAKRIVARGKKIHHRARQEDLKYRKREKEDEAQSSPDEPAPRAWATSAVDSHIATLVERHSRFTALVKISSKDTAVVVASLTRHVRKLLAALRRSLTWDRGLEMAKHKSFTVATDVKVYFCDSAESLATRLQRKHKWAITTILPEENRPV